MVRLGFSLQGNAVKEEPWERQMPGIGGAGQRSCRGGRTAARLVWTLGKLRAQG